MEHVSYSKELITTRKVESFTLTKNIAIVSIVEMVNGMITTSEVFFYHPDEVKNLIDISSEDFDPNRHKVIKNKYKSLCVSRPGFKEAYKTAKYGSDEFYNLDKLFFTPVQLFNYCLANNDIDTSNFEFIYYDNYCGVYYPFNYNYNKVVGQTKGYIHPIKFNNNCYMLTNKEYDLEKIAAIIKPEIETRRIIVPSYDENNEIIQNIPYYNQDEHYTQYINLYIVADLIKEKNVIEQYEDKFLEYATPEYREEVMQLRETKKEN